MAEICIEIISELVSLLPRTCMKLCVCAVYFLVLPPTNVATHTCSERMCMLIFHNICLVATQQNNSLCVKVVTLLFFLSTSPSTHTFSHQSSFSCYDPVVDDFIVVADDDDDDTNDESVEVIGMITKKSI